MKDLSENLKLAIAAAKGAGKILLSYYKQEYTITEKENKTPVTDADFAADNYIIKEIKKQSSHPILTEESKDNLSRMQSDWVWIVDPLDGTNHFISKESGFSTLIGLAYKGRPYLGVSYDPQKNILHYAEKGKGAFIQRGKEIPKRLKVSSQGVFDEMTVAVPYSTHKNYSMVVAERLGMKKLIPIGGFGLRACEIAEGHADCFILFSKKSSEWDSCASEIILTEAGGRMTDTHGNTLKYNTPETSNKHGVVASNGILHGEILLRIQPFLEL
ncbi:MAG: 3'(2'),5'-bisphosphate nucleotidase CysQ [Nanoarchaeota archaeon]